MTAQGKDFPGHIQAGGRETESPWTEATLTTLGGEIIVLVSGTEVARLARPTVTDTGQNDIYLIEGADQPLFFRPRDPAAFREAVMPPMTTAERIAAASARPQDATLVMDRVPDAEPAADSGAGGGDEPPRSRPWWLIVAGIGLLVVLLIAFCGDGEEAGTSTTSTTLLGTSTSAPGTSTATTLSTTTAVPESTTTVPATTSTAPATTTTISTTTSLTLPEPVFGSGTHVVGEDVPPGVYETGIVEDDLGCYWERLSGLSGEFEDIIANGNVSNHDVVEIDEGDAGFGTDCEAWYPLTERDPLSADIPEGKWVLGTHIGPGTYRAPGGETCYWERLSGLSGTIDDVIANDLPSGQAVVEIGGDDLAFNSTDCGEWSPGS